MSASSIHSEFGGYEFLQVRKPSLLENILSNAKDKLPAGAFLNDGWKPLHAQLDTSGITELIKDRVALFLNPAGQAEECPTWKDKCHALYVRDEIDVGIEILPMKSLQAEMSSGPGHYEGELYNVIRNGRGVPAVPLVMIGVAP
jgi:hypothetical protein